MATTLSRDMDCPNRTTHRITRPQDAASLVIVRQRAQELEILLGRRPQSMAFMPGFYVFPGGQVSREDRHIRPTSPLDPNNIPFMAVAGDAGRAQTLAIAAVRETFEETGLLLAQPGDPGPKISPSWSAFRQQGLAPALAPLQYVARAITPTASTIRFHARFFEVDARCFTGNLKSNGELEDLGWRTLQQTEHLPLALVTRHVVAEVYYRRQVPARKPLRYACFFCRRQRFCMRYDS